MVRRFKSRFDWEREFEKNPAGLGGGSVEDAAKRLTISPQSVHQLIDDGLLDAMYVNMGDEGVMIVVPEAEIQRYGVDRTVKPTRLELASSLARNEEQAAEPFDPSRYSLFYSVFQGTQVLREKWLCKWWVEECEKWFAFIDTTPRPLAHYRSYLRDAIKCNAALAEIMAAYFLETRGGLQILEGEPHGAGGTLGEFLVGLPSDGRMFIEVKNPGWKAEVERIQGKDSPRLRQPKYLDGDGGATAPWESVRRAVSETRRKLPDAIPTLLIIVGDLMQPLNWSRIEADIALYQPRRRGCKEGYLAEDGCFLKEDYKRLGALGILDHLLDGQPSHYEFSVFHNPNALKTVAVLPTVFPDYPNYDGPDW